MQHAPTVDNIPGFLDDAGLHTCIYLRLLRLHGTVPTAATSDHAVG